MYGGPHLVEYYDSVSITEDDGIPVRSAIVNDLHRGDPLFAAYATREPNSVIGSSFSLSSKIGYKVVSVGCDNKGGTVASSEVTLIERHYQLFL